MRDDAVSQQGVVSLILCLIIKENSATVSSKIELSKKVYFSSFGNPDFEYLTLG